MPSNTTIKKHGLKRHLNATAAEHNGVDFNGFADLLSVYRHPSGKVNISAIARAMGVDNRTAAGYVKNHKEGQNG